ncbi:hypothetical protein ABID26_004545 [Mesorhizobium shonense]|uniref:Uncharacterized protein n=1 Tax=Mesorhizobium shonense TaxID=1209948 RepID=A0ABV2HX16_9HYPH
MRRISAVDVRFAVPRKQLEIAVAEKAARKALALTQLRSAHPPDDVTDIVGDE